MEARLEAVEFVDCRLAGADFRGARVRASAIRGASLDGVLGVESLRGLRMPWSDAIASAGAMAAALGIAMDRPRQCGRYYVVPPKVRRTVARISGGPGGARAATCVTPHARRCAGRRGTLITSTWPTSHDARTRSSGTLCTRFRRSGTGPRAATSRRSRRRAPRRSRRRSSSRSARRSATARRGAGRPASSREKSSALEQRHAGIPNDSASLTKSGLPKSTSKWRPNFLSCFHTIEPNSRVLPDHVDDRGAQARRGLELLAVHQEAAVAADRDDLAVGVHELGARSRSAARSPSRRGRWRSARSRARGRGTSARSTACAGRRPRPGCRRGRAPRGCPTARAAGASGSGRRRGRRSARPSPRRAAGWMPARGRLARARRRPAGPARGRCRRSARRRGRSTRRSRRRRCRSR